jgi:voltage-gated potassium channel
MPLKGAKEMTLRKRLAKVLEVEDGDVGFERAFNIFLLVLILTNVVAVILETVESLRAQYGCIFDALEVFSVAVFSIEYLLRLWTCVETETYRRPFIGRIRYIFSFMALVDLAAILPAYIPFLLPVDLRFMRAMRLLRLARTLKIARYNRAMHLLVRVVRLKRQELTVTVMLGGILVLISGSHSLPVKA